MDPSKMLENSQKRLKSCPQMKYVKITFQELVETELNSKYDFIISSRYPSFINETKGITI